MEFVGRQQLATDAQADPGEHVADVPVAGTLIERAVAQHHSFESLAILSRAVRDYRPNHFSPATPRRMVVIETKDVFSTFSPATIARSIQKFNEPDRYVDKLLKKVAVVSTDPTAVATALNVANALRNWSVKPLMVTRYVEPAAFVRDQRVPFALFRNSNRFWNDGA